MRPVAFVLALLIFVPVAEAHVLSAERAAHRARFVAADLEDQSHVFTRSSVATSSCVRLSNHRRRCVARLSGRTAEGQSVVCTVRITVRFRGSGYSTEGVLSAYDCQRFSG